MLPPSRGRLHHVRTVRGSHRNIAAKWRCECFPASAASAPRRAGERRPLAPRTGGGRDAFRDRGLRGGNREGNWATTTESDTPHGRRGSLFGGPARSASEAAKAAIFREQAKRGVAIFGLLRCILVENHVFFDFSVGKKNCIAKSCFRGCQMGCNAQYCTYCIRRSEE